jgi:hypothetical protein
VSSVNGLVAIAVEESSGTVTGTGLIDVAGDRPAVGGTPGDVDSHQV